MIRLLIEVKLQILNNLLIIVYSFYFPFIYNPEFKNAWCASNRLRSSAYLRFCSCNVRFTFSFALTNCCQALFNIMMIIPLIYAQHVTYVHLFLQIVCRSLSTLTAINHSRKRKQPSIFFYCFVGSFGKCCSSTTTAWMIK